jgi:hypothetical protein
LIDFTFAPNTGGRARSAVCRPFLCTSMPNAALPDAFAAESRRRVDVPMRLNSLEGFNATCRGTPRPR